MEKLPGTGENRFIGSLPFPAYDPESRALLQHASGIFLRMIDALGKVQELGGEALATLEESFHICVQHWKDFLQSVPLVDMPEKGIVLLLKHIKPLFISEACYYKLLYSAGLFLPEEKKQQQAFWLRELDRTSQFLLKHDLFFQYCREGATHLDAQYFNLPRCPLATFVPEIHHWERKPAPSDMLLAILQAMDRYQHYIHNQLDSLADSR